MGRLLCVGALACWLLLCAGSEWGAYGDSPLVSQLQVTAVGDHQGHGRLPCWRVDVTTFASAALCWG